MFDVNQLLNIIDTNMSRGRHINTSHITKLLDRLYKLSKVDRFTYTKENITDMLNPLIEIKSIGRNIFKDFTIRQFFKIIWVDSTSKPCYKLTLEFDDDIFSLSEDTIMKLRNSIYKGEQVTESEIKDILSDTESEYHSYVRILINKLNTIDLGKYRYELNDYTYLKDYHHVHINLIPK